MENNKHSLLPSFILQHMFLWSKWKQFYLPHREHSGSVAECLTQHRGAPDLSLTGVTVLCPWARHIYPCLVLVHPRKIPPVITEKMLTGTSRIKSNKTYLPHPPIFYTVQSLYNTPCYNADLGLTRSCCGSHFFYHGILQRNFRKMTIVWSFSYNFLVKFILYFFVHYKCIIAKLQALKLKVTIFLQKGFRRV